MEEEEVDEGGWWEDGLVEVVRGSYGFGIW